MTSLCKPDTAASAQLSTRDRILSTALRLFNWQGLSRVPIYKIASEIGISPGNLTYHFARKQDILYALVSELEKEAAVVLSTPRSPGAAEMARYIVGLFRLMWRYHFFFESLACLTAMDKQISDSYHRIMVTAQSGAIQRIEDAVACGDIQPLAAPSNPKILAENMWAVWINRLGLGRQSAEEVGDDELGVYDCCIHHLSLIQPHASRVFISRLHDEIKSLLENDSATSVPAAVHAANEMTDAL